MWGKKFKRAFDSGAEITVVKREVLPEQIDSAGKIRLLSAFGDGVEASRVALPLKLTSPLEQAAPLTRRSLNTCTVTDQLNGGLDVLLTAEDYCSLLETDKAKEELNANADKLICQTKAILGNETTKTQVNYNISNEDQNTDHLDTSMPDENGEGSKRSLGQEQLTDESLKPSWELARLGKNGKFIEDQILYHRDLWYGREIQQVVLPQTRRTKVLNLAHQSSWGGHLGSRKTLSRIRESFFWPGMTEDVKKHCQSCRRCQLRSLPRKSYMIPIKPLTRPEQAFQIVNLDIIGPLDPPSARGHKYALCLVDLCTRWPEVICLRSIKAKPTCEALLQIFARTGIPAMISCDQGTNFTSRLTEEAMKIIGTKLRFSTPGHPQSNGTVERWNRTFKNMLSHAIAENQRDWDRIVPFLLWAYREVPNETTGVSPFELLYGRSPTGPLSILKNYWIGKTPRPDSLNTDIEKYLESLADRLKEAREWATVRANQR